ncbi:MAG TPA: thioredoxin family protein, partial [Chloroflexi bacterium]|nr:thioredoxin family protein [Chloroflexota bacterium]
PAVSGLKNEYSETPFYHIDTMSDQGRILAARYGIRRVPTLLVFDGRGNIALQQAGRIHREAVREAMQTLR